MPAWTIPYPQAASAPPTPEPQAANVFALIHGNGAHGTYTGQQTNSGASGKLFSFDPSNSSFSVTTSESRWGGIALSQTNNLGGLGFSKFVAYFAGGTTEYSIECFIKLNATGVNHVVMATGVGLSGASGEGRQSFGVNSSNVLLLRREARVYADPNISVVGTTALTTGTWYHIACSYDGTTTRLFVDGVLDGSGVTPKGWVNYADNTDMNDPRIGLYVRVGSAGSYIGGNCILDDVRLVHNECIYTADFTAPIAELSAGV